jgi:hypothetical protein
MENVCEKCGKTTPYGATYSFAHGKISSSTAWSGNSRTTATTWQIAPDPIHVFLCHKCLASRLLLITENSNPAAIGAAILGLLTIVTTALSIVDLLDGKPFTITFLIIFLVLAGLTAGLWFVAHKKNEKIKAILSEKLALLEQQPLENFKVPLEENDKKKWNAEGIKFAALLRDKELKGAGANKFWALDDPELLLILEKARFKS